MAQPNKPAKTMSSRLATMKFMQRAAASPSSTPSTPDERSYKRQRLSNGTYNSTPATTPRSDAESVDETLAAEDQKRKVALDREAVARGDSKWYLSFKEPPPPASKTPLRIVSAGYSMLDLTSSALDRSTDGEEEATTTPQVAGRRSFGKFNRRIEKQQNPDISSSDSSDSESSGNDDEDEEEDDGDDPSGAKAMIAQSRKEAGEKARAERKARKKAEKAEAARLAEDRRKKHVKLNNLTSISGTSGVGHTGRSPSGKDMKCFKCGELGHITRDCPKASHQRTGMS